jgi:protein O-GlcNAc transferase
MDINKTIQSAHDHHLAGNAEQAEALYREILIVQPDNAGVHNDIGNLLQELERSAEAIDCYQKAIQLDPGFAGAYYNLAETLRNTGQPDEALGFFKKALELHPDLAGAYYNIGSIFQEKRQFDDAIMHYLKVLKLNPNDPDTLNNLGIIMEEKGFSDIAANFYGKAIEHNPDFAPAYNNLGDILRKTGQTDDAVRYYEKAVQLDPGMYGIHNKLGMILQEKGQLDEAVRYYQKALQTDTASPEAYNNLGTVFQEKGQLDEAVRYYQKALNLDPAFTMAYDNLRYAFQAHLMMMNYNPDFTVQTVFSEHVRFARQYAEPLSPAKLTYVNDCSSARRLKIGYVSPDFRRHPVASFIESALSAHTREHFEIFCYSDVEAADEVTERIQGYADQWRSIAGISDETVAEMVRQDAIDILVDLAGHTDANRMLLFARKSSPVQVTWIGYPATTGLSAIDYKIVDNYTDPPGTTEQFYTEQLMRMPESFLCYRPDSESPEVSSLPALSSGHITFGSFNNFVKVSPKVIELWASIMNALPDCHLMMKDKSFVDQSACQKTIDMFGQKGIDAERILLQPFEKSPAHLDSYNQVDIGLDTFPWNGIATTCDALWMGVPVVTLAGSAYAARAGVSLLSNAGLPELVAGTPEEYISIAVNLANDVEKLRFLREHLRDMMMKSPLCDAKRFTANLEDCYRRIWETWCGKGVEPTG